MLYLLKSLLYPFITPIRDNLKRKEYLKKGYEEYPCIVKDAWGQTTVITFVEQSDGTYLKFEHIIDRGESQPSRSFLKISQIKGAVLDDRN